jgi:excisionase family DNA binding protein
MTNSLPEPVFISAPRAATLCGVSRNTVCCWIRATKLPSYRTAGGKNLIRPGDLVAFMQKHGLFISPALQELAERDQQAQTPAAAGPVTQKEPAILVVDDDPQARAMAVRALKKLGHPILEAQTGYEALHILVQHPEVALIVLDLVMPGQHGTETFAQIRRQNKAMPVIIVTGFAPDGTEGVFGEDMPDLIINKPYDPQHLIEAARAYLSDLGI